jgi:hypothetical protein
MLFKAAVKHGVSPKLISERLLSKEDKEDMLNGLVSFETLDCFITVWKANKMYNCSDGSGAFYSDLKT